mgnify:CR=1 FL=1
MLNPSEFLAIAERHRDRLIALRRTIHANPELAFQETRTAGVVVTAVGATLTKTVQFEQILQPIAAELIVPEQRGVTPSYEQKHFAAEEKRGKLRLIASRDGADGSVRIHQDANVYAGLFDGEERAEFAVGVDRQVYVHVARGSITANGNALNAGDALASSDAGSLSLSEGQGAEVLVFDLARAQ